MTRRERTLFAIDHKPVDKVPVQLLLEPRTTLKIASYVKKPQNFWARHLMKLISTFSPHLPTEEIRDIAPLLIYLFEQEYLLELGADMVGFPMGDPTLWFRKLWQEQGKIRIKDMYGITRGMCGLYLETVDVPCKTKNDMENYRFPDISSPVYYRNVRRFRKKHPDVGITAACMGVQDWSQSFHTMEKIYSGMVYYPKTIKKFFQRTTEHTLPAIKGSLQAGADIIIILDDYGTQNSMFISKEMWEEFTYPCLKKQIEVIHEYGGKALLHSDGYIMPLLDKLVEAELDAFHPFQLVEKNDLKKAKKLYGKKLAFFTGIDVQRIPQMTKDEVREDIVRTYKIASPGGGLVLSMTNGLQHDTSPENLKEIFATLQDIRKGEYN